MGLMHIVGACCCSQGEFDEEKLSKLHLYMCWFTLMLFGTVIGYVLESWIWGIGLTAFIILIGVCGILLKKENEKETIKEQENELD